MPEKQNIPLFVDRALEIALSENAYARSDANKQALYTEIKKYLPDMSEDTMVQQAIDAAIKSVSNDFFHAWEQAFDACEAANMLTSGQNDLPDQCFTEAFFTNPNSEWPAPVNPKRIAISVGHIPAQIADATFIFNKPNDRQAIKTAYRLAKKGFDVTIVAWQYTRVPNDIMMPKPYKIDGKTVTYPGVKNIVRVKDVLAYHKWFVDNAKNYDAFIMTASTTKITPVKPFETCTPLNASNPDARLNIEFRLAPRTIDAIKTLNPHTNIIVCEYHDTESCNELIEITRNTPHNPNADLIFVSTPDNAHNIGLTQDGVITAHTFDEYIDCISQNIQDD